MEEYKKVTISFTKEQLEKLDEIMSKEQGYSRSSLVREAVDYYLGYLAQKGSVSYLSPIISQNIKNTLAYLCEQRDSHPVSPYFALCAVRWRKARKYPSKPFAPILSICRGL